ncbi:PAS domain-containing protein [Mesorhizobium sp. BR115XR7A]|uniref:sensor histidine kinase n=1 Tax=Mesorhizobium sp. BR115XR7A TaxID=2876645 RepID=UPI001CCAB4CF|nr:HWE histidine kinase domain-containing protein [Mesorhizobium sp. BR115XR7A]MBZ9905447.1 PAS domain-containing protein [Mesorhizobium sp. BR115XR7A]MBZ9929603.1 PAS domain-containing protein [Mesorhizobium sp. BR1-1-5]
MDLPRRSVRSHLLALTAAAVVPVWLFAGYLLGQYALHERYRFEQDAVQTARQVSLVVEGELANLKTILDGLSKSAALASGDLQAFHREALDLVHGTDRTIVLRDLGGNQLMNTEIGYGAALPSVAPIASVKREKLSRSGVFVSDVFSGKGSGEYRVAVAVRVPAPKGEDLLLTLSVPTARIRDVLMPAVPQGWTVGVGDRDGNYVARSRFHDEWTGKRGLPEYVEKIVARSGSFTSRNFEGETLLAGYYRSPDSDWFYTANVPLAAAQAPLWRSLAAICGIGLLSLLVSVALAYFVGKGFTRATAELATRAEALGHGRSVEALSTSVTEFAAIAQAMVDAERAIAERRYELEAVLETAPAAVWFTYDPKALQVIRNRFAAELMGLPTDAHKTFGSPDLVIDTVAVKDGHIVSREDRPLSRAMRGQLTDHEEFVYTLPSGVERLLLSSARPIRNPSGGIIGAVQISLDITERKRGEEQLKLLTNELNHRVKNILAVVQSIASQTLRNATSLAEAGRTLSSRLVSLAKANDLLIQQNWSGADVRDLIATSVSSHAPIDRFGISGKSVWLSPNVALSAALAFHELTTNALKYGALSNETGTVSIHWKLVGQKQHRWLNLEWRERGGPPVEPIERKGFGTQLLERVFASGTSGRVTLKFHKSGLICTMRMNAASEVNPAVDNGDSRRGEM